LDFLSGSSAVLLVIPSKNKADEMIPGKLFEYMASKRPIIALGSRESDVAEILNLTNSGKIFEKQDSKELGEYIIQLVNNFNNGLFENNPESLELYSRKNLSKEIADIINII
jgi:glycosyltransferase involved in cell wall biosynthesis